MIHVRISEGQIIDGPGDLPKVFANINGFDKLSQQELASHGWFPFHGDPEPEYDPRTHKAVRTLLIGDIVRSAVTVEPLTETEVQINLESLRQEMLADNADYRWQREVGGIEFFGNPAREIPIPIATDRNSQHAIFEAMFNGESKNWKCRDGEWRVFTPGDFALLYASIDQHRQICFETEAENASLIQGCDTFAELDAIDLVALWNSE